MLGIRKMHDQSLKILYLFGVLMVVFLNSFQLNSYAGDNEISESFEGSSPCEEKLKPDEFSGELPAEVCGKIFLCIILDLKLKHDDKTSLLYSINLASKMFNKQRQIQTEETFFPLKIDMQKVIQHNNIKHNKDITYQPSELEKGFMLGKIDASFLKEYSFLKGYFSVHLINVPLSLLKSFDYVKKKNVKILITDESLWKPGSFADKIITKESLDEIVNLIKLKPDTFDAFRNKIIKNNLVVNGFKVSEGFLLSKVFLNSAQLGCLLINYNCICSEVLPLIMLNNNDEQKKLFLKEQLLIAFIYVVKFRDIDLVNIFLSPNEENFSFIRGDDFYKG